MSVTIKEIPPAIPLHRLHEYGGPRETRAYELAQKGVLDLRKMGRRTVVTGESFKRYIASLPKFVSQVA